MKHRSIKRLSILAVLALFCALLSGCMVPRGNWKHADEPLSENPDAVTHTAEPTGETSVRPEETMTEKPEETSTVSPTESPIKPSTRATRPTEESTEPPTEEPTTPEQTDPPEEEPAVITKTGINLDPGWEFADFSVIHDGAAVLYHTSRSNGITVGVNAGHGTRGGERQKTYCHPDMTPKVTGGTTGKGAIMAYAVSGGMTFRDGTEERAVTLAAARFLRDKLLEAGYDVLMIRDEEDVQLDNVARTVLCNNRADCHIALHWDSDSKDFDKGIYYMSVPEGIKYLPNVARHWEESERLGECLLDGLREAGGVIFGRGSSDMDLTQTSYSTVPSVDIELGNQCSDHSEQWLENLAEGLLMGIEEYFEQ